MSHIYKKFDEAEREKFTPLKKALFDAVSGYAEMNQRSMSDDNPEILTTRDAKGKQDTRQDLGIGRLIQSVRLKLFGGSDRHQRLLDEIWNAKNDRDVLNIARRELENSKSSRLKLYIAVFLGSSDLLTPFTVPKYYHKVPAAHFDFDKESVDQDYEFKDVRDKMTHGKFYNHMNLGGFISMNAGAISELEKNVLKAVIKHMPTLPASAIAQDMKEAPLPDIKEFTENQSRSDEPISPPSYEQATREDKAKAAGFQPLPFEARVPDEKDDKKDEKSSAPPRRNSIGS